ncbi:hypothetical protein GOP47_0007054, partial [Adiantum capillus-veneris]
MGSASLRATTTTFCTSRSSRPLHTSPASPLHAAALFLCPLHATTRPLVSFSRRQQGPPHKS